MVETFERIVHFQKLQAEEEGKPGKPYTTDCPMKLASNPPGPYGKLETARPYGHRRRPYHASGRKPLDAARL